VLTAPHSPWQNPCAERLIGSIRRECLNHVIVLGERHLRRTLARYFAYYHQARTHLALDKDAPHARPIELPAARRIGSSSSIENQVGPCRILDLSTDLGCS
jgi:transposase InsO family protein